MTDEGDASDKEERATEAAPFGEPVLLSCFFLDCAVNLLPRLIVNFHVVLFTTMLLDLWHDLRFAFAADLPVTVLRANVRTAETYFFFAMFPFRGRHFFLVSPVPMLLPIL
jgi:hypothetical protein